MMISLTKSRTLISKTLTPNSFKSISTFSLLDQRPQVSDHPFPPPPSDSSFSPPPKPLDSSYPPPPPPSGSSFLPPPLNSSFPPSPSYSSPLYNQNWRNLNPYSNPGAQSLVPFHFQQESQARDADSLMNLFADWVTLQRWDDVRDVFEKWIRSLDVNGKPNRPNVELFNQYLWAHLMCGADTGALLEVVQKMEEYAVEPNTASYNLVLKSVQVRDWPAAVSLLERMLQSGKESQPDDESFDLVLGMLFQQDQIETTLKYVGLTLKSGYRLSSRVFGDCVRSCVMKKRLDTLVSIIEKCKPMNHNKVLSPSCNLCFTLAEAAIQNDNSRLTFIALGFMARWMQQGENMRVPVYLSVNEGLVIKSLCTAAHTYNSTLLDASWAILKKSLRGKKFPNPETYLAKINALASLGNLPSAFSTLSELEKVHSDSSTAAEEDLLSPFTSLHPPVVAC